MLLALDTATEWVHLALLGDDNAWSKRVLTSPANNASKVLLHSVDELLQEAKAQRSAISGVIACIGPGGFTSLRVGIATAEGLGVLGLQTWGFSAFELRAFAIKEENPTQKKQVTLVLDGQRGEAFVQTWDMAEMRPVAKASRIPLKGLHSVIGENHWWTTSKFFPSVAIHTLPPPIVLMDEGHATLTALAKLGRACSQRQPENTLPPFYLRETDAELNFPNASAHLNEAHRQGQSR